MQSAIIYAVIPEGSHSTQQSAERLLAAIATLKGDEAVKRLGVFVWRISEALRMVSPCLFKLVRNSDCPTASCRLATNRNGFAATPVPKNDS
jgi:hypothetical protein